jgi:pSer/pThr/pTyr-binding forkhead associated (FHA) protein
MATAACTTPTQPQAPTEAFEPSGVLGHGARRESLAFVRPAPGRYLAIEDGELTRLVALHQSVTHLGRGFSADLRLEDQSVSRRHAVIVDGGDRDGPRILDDRSANGTFVNERRIAEAVLRDRDVIRLGRVTLVYRDVTG